MSKLSKPEVVVYQILAECSDDEEIIKVLGKSKSLQYAMHVVSLLPVEGRLAGSLAG